MTGAGKGVNADLTKGGVVATTWRLAFAAQRMKADGADWQLLPSSARVVRRC